MYSHGLEMRKYASNGVQELVFDIDEVQTTLLRLELSADNIKFTRTVASGALKKVEMVDNVT